MVIEQEFEELIAADADDVELIVHLITLWATSTTVRLRCLTLFVGKRGEGEAGGITQQSALTA